MKKSKFHKVFIGLLIYKPWLFVGGLICNILIFSHSAAVAYFVREILNTVEKKVSIGGNVFSEIKLFLLGILGVSLIRVVAITICAVMDNIQAFHYENLLRNNIMKIIYKHSNIKNVAGNSEKVFEVVDDDVPICAFPSELLSEVSGYVVYSFIAISSLLIINWKVTIYIFIPLSVSIIIIQRATSKIKKNRKLNREVHEKVSETISDFINSVQTIKTSGAKESVLKHYEKINEKRLRYVLKDKFFESSIQAVIGSTVYIGTAIMMLVASKGMIKGEFPIGDFSMFVCYLGTLADCVNRVMELVSETKQAEVSYDRIIDIIGKENEDELMKYSHLKAFGEMGEFKYEAKEKASLEDLEVRGVNYKHDEKTGIHDVNFNVKKGELLVIAGGVGSGKSTLLNVLMGILPKDSGKVLWNGRDIENHNEFFTAPNVGYTSQVSKMFTQNIGENLLMGKQLDRDEISEALYNAVFDKDVSEMDKGLDTYVGSGGNMLSGGQKQRLAMSRMMLNNAELYIMDDSTSAIDNETENEFWRRFDKNLSKNKFACIIASNKKQALDRADKVIFMEDGHVVDIGKARELYIRCEEFAKIYAS